MIVDCPYKEKCRSAGSFKCVTCKHNKKAQKDYYEPVDEDYIKPIDFVTNKLGVD